jgi:hypothetical protein
MNKVIKFSAIIEQNSAMNAAYVDFPYNVEELFGVRGLVKVKATFDNKITYRGSLAKMGFPCHILGITREIRNQLNKSFGDIVDVELILDTEKREAQVSVDILELFNEFNDLKLKFYKMSYSHQKEYMQWIESAKKEETRQRRIEKFAIMLMERP